MKRYLLFLWVGISLGVPVAFALEEGALDVQSLDSPYEEARREAQRNKELLEIWKEHVRTLTEERNAAYKQLDALKGMPPQAVAGSMRQFGGVETIPVMAPAAGAGGKNFQEELAALESQKAAILAELNQSQAQNNLLVKEKEEALSELERIKQSAGTTKVSIPTQPGQSYRKLLDNYELQKERLAKANERIREAENEAATLRRELERVRASAEEPVQNVATLDQEQLLSEKEEALRQIRELNYQKETLIAKSEKLEIVQKELDDTRAYLTPMIEELQKKNQALEEKLAAARQTQEALVAEKASLEDSARNLQSSLEAQEKVQSENEQLRAEVNRLNGEIDQLLTYKAEVEKLNQEIQSVRMLYSGADAQSRKKQADLDALNAKFEESVSAQETLSKERDFLLALKTDNAKEIAALKETIESLHASAQKAEALKQSLKADLSDLKNFQTNVQSYLESLVASFQERQDL